MYRKVTKIKEGFLVYPRVGVFTPQKSTEAEVRTLPCSPLRTLQPIFQHLAAHHCPSTQNCLPRELTLLTGKDKISLEIFFNLLKTFVLVRFSL